MNELDAQTADAIKELVAKISTSKFKEKVRNRIAQENEQFRQEEASLRPSRRQYLQTFDL